MPLSNQMRYFPPRSEPLHAKGIFVAPSISMILNSLGFLPICLATYDIEDEVYKT